MPSPTVTADPSSAAEHASERRGPQLGNHPALATVTSLVVLAVLAAPTTMPAVARLTLGVFVVLLSLTAFTKASEVAVCIGALAALVLVGASSVGDAVGTMTSHTVILLTAAFVVAAAARRSGLAERLAFAIGGRARTVDQLLVRITWVLIGTAFLVPSTSGRAALMLPVYLAFAERIPQQRVRRALAVLFPAAILLSAVASLFGAGAHLVMTELLVGFGERRIGFLEWAVYGLPFAVASCLVALQVVRWSFLDQVERSAAVDLRRESAPWTRTERITASVLAAVTVLWLTEPLHGIAPWIVAVVGAVVVTVGPARVVSISEARSAVPLDLLFVMAVTAEAGSALARTGAADWVALTLLGPLARNGGAAPAVVLVIGLVSLLAHLVVTSRTARASVLLPVVILVGGAAGLDVTALAYLSTAAAGYCLTTTTSAKPMRVFATVDDGYDERDLRRLSIRLLPLHVLLLLGFSFAVWPMLGMALGSDDDTRPALQDPAPAVVDAESLPWADARIDDLGIGPRWERSAGTSKLEAPTMRPTRTMGVAPAQPDDTAPPVVAAPPTVAPAAAVAPVAPVPSAPPIVVAPTSVAPDPPVDDQPAIPDGSPVANPAPAPTLPIAASSVPVAAPSPATVHRDDTDDDTGNDDTGNGDDDDG